MKELELNIENLLSIGLTPDILKNNFENWIIENKDIFIDFDKKIIYTGILDLRKELDNLQETIKNDLLQDGQTAEELDEILNSETQIVKASFKKIMNSFPNKESEQEFLIHILPKLYKQISKTKINYFNNKLADLIKESNPTKKINPKLKKIITTKNEVNFQNKKIFYTLKEYQKNYNIFLNNYLKQHEDFDELMFIEIELQFYNLCYDNSNLVICDFGNGPEYCINGGHCELLLQEINEAITYSEGYDVVLSTKFLASFSKIINFLADKKAKVATGSNKSFSVIDDNILTSETYCENLINDPLFSPENDYMTLKEAFKDDCISRTAHLNNPYDFFVEEFDGHLQEWENTQKEKINNTFLRLVKELNQNKIFFFGCSFDNYKRKYIWRLDEFLEHYTDASEVDFIEDELKFLENILYDLQNPEAAHDGHSLTGYDIFSKAYEFVSIVGYKHYFFSHNKKVHFLKEMLEFVVQQKELSKPKYFDISSIDDEQEKPKTFELSKKEQEQLDDEYTTDERESQNNLLKSTIEDYLEEFKPDINGDGYEILINALIYYFTNGEFPVLHQKIKFKKINKKRVGWALKELYKSEKTDNLEIEYFRFAQENINLFEKEVIVTENFNKSNFYKTFTSNPAK